MNQHPKSLAEMFASDPNQIPTMPKGMNPEDLARRTQEHEERFGAEINTEARLAGRPRKVLPRRITEVRSLRLESTLWSTLEARVEIEGCSINRYIEEAILARLGWLEAPNDLFELAIAGAYRAEKPYPTASRENDKVVSFELATVA